MKVVDSIAKSVIFWIRYSVALKMEGFLFSDINAKNNNV